MNQATKDTLVSQLSILANSVYTIRDHIETARPVSSELVNNEEFRSAVIALVKDSPFFRLEIRAIAQEAVGQMIRCDPNVRETIKQMAQDEAEEVLENSERFVTPDYLSNEYATHSDVESIVEERLPDLTELKALLHTLADTL